MEKLKQAVCLISPVLTFGYSALMLPLTVIGMIVTGVDDGEVMVGVFLGIISVLFVVPVVFIVFWMAPKIRKYLCISGWLAISLLYCQFFISRSMHASELEIRLEQNKLKGNIVHSIGDDR